MDPDRKYLKSIDNSLIVAIWNCEQIIAEKFKGEDWKTKKGSLRVHEHKQTTKVAVGRSKKTEAGFCWRESGFYCNKKGEISWRTYPHLAS